MFDGLVGIIDSIKNLFSNEKEVFYVNGADTLPPPLSAEEEIKVIEKLKTDENARKTLIEHNLRLVVYIAKKFENINTDIEDLISIGTIGLMKAVNTYNPDKNIKLATYASRCIENEILMYIRKTNNQKAEISIEEPLSTDGEGNELLLCDILGNDEDPIFRELEYSEDKKAVYKALMELNKREREIIMLRFGIGGRGKELTQKEVADKLGISQSYISRLEKRIMVRLRKEIEDKV